MMVERVISIELGVRWEPNDPAAVLCVRDDGTAELTLQPHPGDADERLVRFVWHSCIAAMMQPPNDEARSGHRLYDKGLRGLIWAGEILDSQWIADLEHQNRVHPLHDPARFANLRHFILPLKERTVEVVATGWETLRSEAIRAEV